MAKTYFSKQDPKGAVYLSDGSRVPFERVNLSLGVFATESDRVANELRSLMAQGRGGIDQITESEFNALLQKKKLESPWRSEVTKESLFSALNVPIPLESPPASLVATEPVHVQRSASKPSVLEEPERPKATKR